MNIPDDPTMVQVIEAGFDYNEKVAERNHMLDQHRDPHTGAHPRMQDCPSEPCVTWRRYSTVFTRWQTRRFPS